jgi:hypothetical protein
MTFNTSNRTSTSSSSSKYSGEISPMPSPTLPKSEAVKPQTDRKEWKQDEEKPSEAWARLSGRKWKGYN